jgi:hypothetical protein
MPSITCPSCGTGLKIKVDLPPGKRIKCPRCETTFAPEGDGEPGAVPAGAVQSGPPRPAPAPPPRRSREEEDDFDDEPARPARRKRKPARKGANPILILCLAIAAGVLFVGGGVTVLISLLSKGGGASSAYGQNEAVAKELVQALTDMAEALESVKDANSAKTAAGKLNTICDRVEGLAKRAKELPKLTQAEDKRLKDQYEPQMRTLAGRMQNAGFEAGRRCGGEPSFLEAAKRRERLGKDLQRMGI